MSWLYRGNTQLSPQVVTSKKRAAEQPSCVVQRRGPHALFRSTTAARRSRRFKKTRRRSSRRKRWRYSGQTHRGKNLGVGGLCFNARDEEEFTFAMRAREIDIEGAAQQFVPRRLVYRSIGWRWLRRICRPAGVRENPAACRSFANG